MISLRRLHKSTLVDGETNKFQRGFTLVELAIVLVIIGLVLAAVLKGQELIVSARLKSTISAVDEVRSASQTFRDKYGGLPGDYAQAQVRVGDPAGVTWAAVGDGDGVIQGDGIGGAVGDETLLFWNQLSAANMLSGVSPLGGAALGDGIPKAPVGGGFTIRNELIINKTTHWLTLGSAAVLPTGVLDAEQALMIDEKADDGRPGTGSTRSTTVACTDVVAPATIDGTSAYNADPSVTGCLLVFEL